MLMRERGEMPPSDWLEEPCPDWLEGPRSDWSILAGNSGSSLVLFGARVPCFKSSLATGPYHGRILAASWFCSVGDAVLQ